MISHCWIELLSNARTPAGLNFRHHDTRPLLGAYLSRTTRHRNAKTAALQLSGSAHTHEGNVRHLST